MERVGKELEIEAYVAGLAAEYGERRKELILQLGQAKGLRVRKREIKTIGIFYYKMAQGGLQRVISLLIPMYLQLGYQVVLFTDEWEPEKEYALPKQVTRVLLPSAMTLPFAQYGERAAKLAEAIRTYGVDVMLYHAAECRMLVYDMLLVKSFGIPFCVTVHGMFCAEMLRQDYYIQEKLVTFQMVDCLVVLSRMEQEFWQTFGIKAFYLPNPIQELPYSEADSEEILWLGRFEKAQKQYMQTLDIMKSVVKSVPEAKLKIVGNDVTKGAAAALKKRIRKLHLETNVEVYGFSLDVAQYYQKAGIFLVTSSWEAFPMTIVESKGYGIPLVTYEMPYLEALKQGGGYISVPQDDTEAAAEAVVKLLRQKELRLAMKRDARKSYEALQAVNLPKLWKDLLVQLGSGEPLEVPAGETREAQKEMLSTVLQQYQKGCEKNGTHSEYVLVRLFTKLSRIYVVWRENGFGATWKIIKSKAGK